MANLCFTRDRLLFYEQQQAVAKRARWERQEFWFETAYHLNFYYLLLYGGFDQVAQVVNVALGLGLPLRNVGATYKGFLDVLEQRAPEVHALFVAPKNLAFKERLGALRHLTAHRGSITPSKVYFKPEVEPTTEELDADITKAGLDGFLASVHPLLAKSFRETLRFKMSLKRCELWEEGMVLIETEGKYGWIKPTVDTCWNLDTFLRFLTQVLGAVRERL